MRRTQSSLFGPLQQASLGVQGTRRGRRRGDFGREGALDEITRHVVTAFQIDRGDDRLEGVGEDGRALASALLDDAATDTQMTTEFESARRVRE